MEQVEQWWRQTYKLPSNHELFLNRTIEEHLVDMYEHLFIEKPIEMHRQLDGEVQFTETGDPMIDKWEQELADGYTPDLSEVFSPEEMVKLKRARANFKSKGGKTFKEVMEQMSRESAMIEKQADGKFARRKTFG